MGNLRKARILAETGQIGTYRLLIQMVMAELAAAGFKHGHQCVEFGFENGISVDIDHLHVEVVLAAQ